MKMRSSVLALALVSVLGGTGCSKVVAKAAFKDANKDYKSEDFKKAIKGYERATKYDPNMAEAWFYLGSSHQALFRPGKTSPENLAQLDAAIDAYKKAIEVNPNPVTPNQKTIKENTLASLTSIYADDPKKDFDTALRYANELVQANPTETKNLYAMANLYEKFEKVDKAEETYKQVAEKNPNDVKACGALAGFYNKPLWDGKSKFDQAITILERCSTLDPNDPGGYQKVAVFYWDKAFRDPLLTDQQKDQYADKGLAAVDKALALKPDYFDATVFKGLLLRVKANATGDNTKKQQLMAQALEYQKRAGELKKQAAEAAAAAAAAAGASALAGVTGGPASVASPTAKK
jgi:tetratricopeptide (TPR) repeat protein